MPKIGSAILNVIVFSVLVVITVIIRFSIKIRKEYGCSSGMLKRMFIVMIRVI